MVSVVYSYYCWSTSYLNKSSYPVKPCTVCCTFYIQWRFIRISSYFNLSIPIQYRAKSTRCRYYQLCRVPDVFLSTSIDTFNFSKVNTGKNAKMKEKNINSIFGVFTFLMLSEYFNLKFLVTNQNLIFAICFFMKHLSH